MGEGQAAIYEDLQCSYCGVAVQLGTLDVTVQRADNQDGRLAWDTLDLWFCKEGHAADYFRESRLPAPEYESPDLRPLGWADRLFDAGLYLVLAAILAIFVIGAWAVVRWVLP